MAVSLAVIPPLAPAVRSLVPVPPVPVPPVPIPVPQLPSPGKPAPNPPHQSPRQRVEARSIQIANRHWGDPCGGRVSINHNPLPVDVLARASWDSGASNRPPYTDCSIDIAPVMRSASAPRLCTAIVHEYGHLAGHGHSRNPRNLMYAYYAGVWPGCRSVG